MIISVSKKLKSDQFSNKRIPLDRAVAWQARDSGLILCPASKC